MCKQIVFVLSADRLEYVSLLDAAATVAKFVVRNCKTICVTDIKTRSAMDGWGRVIADIVDEVVVVDSPYSSPLSSSRYLKTILRDRLRGDFLFLDLDALIVNPDVFEGLEHGCSCIAAAQNLDALNQTPSFPDWVGNDIYRHMGWEYPFMPYVNSGVLFCRDTSECHELFKRWNCLWTQQQLALNIHYDQPALNRAIWESPNSLKLLAAGFNAPVDVCPEFADGAQIYHYYVSLSSGKPRHDSLLNIILWEKRNFGNISSLRLGRLISMKRAFIPEFFSVRYSLAHYNVIHALRLLYVRRMERTNIGCLSQAKGR